MSRDPLKGISSQNSDYNKKKPKRNILNRLHGASSDKKFQELNYAQSPRKAPDNQSVNSMSFIEQISSTGDIPLRIGRPIGELTALQEATAMNAQYNLIYKAENTGLMY